MSYPSLAAVAVLMTALAVVAARPASAAGKTVVPMHGAFADGSSWSKVIPFLQAKGLKVVAVQNPLSPLAADVDATRRVIDAWNGLLLSSAMAASSLRRPALIQKSRPSSMSLHLLPERAVGERARQGSTGTPLGPAVSWLTAGNISR
jgi:hypothetical protein